MAFQPVTNVALTRLEGVVDGQETINTLYWEISGGGINVVNLTSLVSAVGVWFNTVLAPLLSDDWSTSRVVGVDLTTQTGPEVVAGGTTAGGVSGEANPNNVAATVTFRTAARGRSFRGRNFVPGIPGSVVTLNTLDPTFQTDLVNAYLSLSGPGSFLAGWQWGVVSRFSAGVLRASGLFSPITSVDMVGNVVRSMRSREVGHGK